MRDASRLSAQEVTNAEAVVSSQETSKMLTSREVTQAPVLPTTVLEQPLEAEVSRDKTKMTSRDGTRPKEKTMTSVTQDPTKLMTSQENTKLSRKGPSRGPAILPQKSIAQGRHKSGVMWCGVTCTDVVWRDVE